MPIFAPINISGYGEIGRHARLRIWCRKACRFESYYPHKKKLLNREAFFVLTLPFLFRIIHFESVHESCGIISSDILWIIH